VGKENPEVFDFFDWWYANPGEDIDYEGKTWSKSGSKGYGNDYEYGGVASRYGRSQRRSGRSYSKRSYSRRSYNSRSYSKYGSSRRSSRGYPSSGRRYSSGGGGRYYSSGGGGYRSYGSGGRSGGGGGNHTGGIRPVNLQEIYIPRVDARRIEPARARDNTKDTLGSWRRWIDLD
jgi:hypothetical protein